MIFNLRPLHYDKMELIPALTNYLKSYETQTHIKTGFSVSGDEMALFPRTKIFLFRIVQEALSNVEKHAKAQQADVHLRIDPDRLTVTITDDGIGFDTRAAAAGFGLTSMRERARAIGAHLVVRSAPGRGTTVALTVPGATSTCVALPRLRHRSES